tara:strand:- start:739 stop:1101 length:363 start_codon:yes stop_codon:yes gene_type:complete
MNLPLALTLESTSVWIDFSLSEFHICVFSIFLISAVEKSLEIVFEAIKVHGKHVGISFNGGKDACVCLEVLRLGLQLYKKKFPDMSFCPTLQQVPVMYYRHEKKYVLPRFLSSILAVKIT